MRSKGAQKHLVSELVSKKDVGAERGASLGRFLLSLHPRPCSQHDGHKGQSLKYALRDSEHHKQHNMQKRISALVLHLSALQLIVDVALCESFVCSFNITGNSTYPYPVSISEATISCQAGADSNPTAKLPVAIDAALIPFSTSFSGKHLCLLPDAKYAWLQCSS